MRHANANVRFGRGLRLPRSLAAPAAFKPFRHFRYRDSRRCDSRISLLPYSDEGGSAIRATVMTFMIGGVATIADC